MKKMLICFLFLSATFGCLAQAKFTKEDISRNWMVWSLESPDTQGKEILRTELGKKPKADFVINSSGEYSIRFENIGSGTWRIDGDIIIFWGTNIQTKSTRIDLIAKVISVTQEQMILKILMQTKHYDWTLKLVPFN